MKKLDPRVIWGVVLVAAGLLFLLQNLGYLPFGGLLWAALFAVAGAFFVGVFLYKREHWWAIIPGLTLLGVALVIALSVVYPEQSATWVGAAFLGMIGLAFWVVYFSNRNFWWAIIPGGVLITLAIIAGTEKILGGFESGGLLFIGLGLTFGLVGLVPTPDGQMKWAFIPATILLIMGVLISAAATSWINYLWPLVIICVGAYLVLRTFMVRHTKPTDQS